MQLPDSKHDIPERLKADNWAFHVLSRSDDPALKCLNIGNLVRNFKTTFQIAEIENEPVVLYGKSTTLIQFIDYQILGANTAWNQYAQGKTGNSVETANAVLESVLFIVYDKRYTTARSDSFVGASK